MNITIPDELLEKNHLSSQKIKQEIALFLLKKCNLTLEQATQIAETPIIEFKKLLETNKKIPQRKFGKLSHLKNRNCVEGNSNDLVHIDWSEQWNKPLIEISW